MGSKNCLTKTDTLGSTYLRSLSKKALLMVMFLRLSKCLLTASFGLFSLLAALFNALEPSGNLSFLEAILGMTHVTHDYTVTWRSIRSPPLQLLTFWTIVLIEFAIAALCFAGSGKLFLSRKQNSAQFQEASYSPL
ncbi:DUF2165 family protein [Flexibacterium corallicola]|uniref:DUF2165 family protein n=1 Tax=Flexibacterium corallicola TaxID=3037259 RepID=UPI0038620753